MSKFYFAAAGGRLGIWDPATPTTLTRRDSLDVGWGVPAYKNNHVRRLIVFSDDDIWMFGGKRGVASTPCCEHWNGSAWEGLLTPGAGLPALPGVSGFYPWIFNDAVAFAPDDIYALATYQGVSGVEPGGFVFHYNGSSWSIVHALAVGKKGVAIDGASGSDLYVLANYQNFSQYYAEVYWYNGSSWQTDGTLGPTKLWYPHMGGLVKKPGADEYWIIGGNISSGLGAGYGIYTGTFQSWTQIGTLGSTDRGYPNGYPTLDFQTPHAAKTAFLDENGKFILPARATGIWPSPYDVYYRVIRGDGAGSWVNDDFCIQTFAGGCFWRFPGHLNYPHHTGMCTGCAGTSFNEVAFMALKEEVGGGAPTFQNTVYFWNGSSWTEYVVPDLITYAEATDGADINNAWNLGGAAALSDPVVRRRQPVIVSIENGEGTGFDLAYDGYNFISPYDAAGSKIEAVSVGDDTAYDFTIERQDSWVGEGRVGIRAEVPDGYDGPTDRDPFSGETEVSRDHLVEFRVTESE